MYITISLNPYFRPNPEPQGSRSAANIFEQQLSFVKSQQQMVFRIYTHVIHISPVHMIYAIFGDDPKKLVLMLKKSFFEIYEICFEKHNKHI